MNTLLIYITNIQMFPAIAITAELLEALAQQEMKLEREPEQSHAALVDTWVQAMRAGLITGRPYSDYTVTDYHKAVSEFLTNHKRLSYGTFEEAMLRISPKHYAKRFRLYKGLVCFAKFLFKRGAIDADFLMQVKPLFPKRHTPPKRAGITEAEFSHLLTHSQTPFLRMALVVLVGTGLRAGEAVALRWDDLDLDKGMLTVRCGKWGKARRLGLAPSVLEELKTYRETVTSEWVFCDETGAQLSRMGLYHRFKRLGDRAGVSVSPHALRRAFVTFNAGKGRPMVYLQKSCGHSDIRITMSYCLTSEEEVIEAMKGWE